MRSNGGSSSMTETPHNVDHFDCRICGHSSLDESYVFREMMFGSRDEFVYFRCPTCGTLQIAEIPELDKYYPSNYGPLVRVPPVFPRMPGARFLVRLATRYFLDPQDAIGRLAAKLIKLKTGWVEEWFPSYLREPLLQINQRSRILDFGSGAGDLLNRMHYHGFRHLTGADRFIRKEIDFENGVTILKKDLFEFTPNSFDLVILSHVLEHLPDPLEALQNVHRLLSPDRFCLIRIPVASAAWDRYGKDWFQLDPPRHLYTFTEPGFAELAAMAGFAVDKIVYDSDASQFFVSEFYRLDIPYINAHRKAAIDKFGLETVVDWDAKAQELNAQNRGDQACFYLRRTGQASETRSNDAAGGLII